ncbi:heavy metal translocating P-type ATPase [Orbus sturtevantii]|uniref:heavy metal translocating P-type ATPase n=1 Tax=Orbus sturtevantii TaxID=3074109 RepID=UPI00370D0658
MSQRKHNSSCCNEQQSTVHHHKTASHGEHQHQKKSHHCGCNDEHAILLANDKPIPISNDRQAVYRIRNMDCPTEEALIRKKLANMAGIIALEFNLIQRILTVHHRNASLPSIEAALTAIDMDPEPILNFDTTADFTPIIKWKQLALAGILALAAEITHFISGPNWLVLTLALVAIAIGGIGTYKKGWIALKNLNLNMNALMSFAVTGALIIGQWPEAAMVMVLFTLAEAIEAKSMDRARDAIKNLLSLTPERATVLQTDGTWQDVDVKAVLIDSVVRVKPGERIALDGKITSGQSTINQAPITGESLPTEKGMGDQVFAGTINESGSFEYKVTALATQSTLARIIKAVESAQGSKAQTQRFVDRFAKIYTPIVFIIALCIGLIPPLFMHGIWFDWIYKALVLLVIACPCALVISTPVTIVSGLAAATRYGILIKGGMYLEQGRKLSTLALDKTGTITYGKPKQTDFIKLGSSSEQDIRQIAASLASRSDHPVSKAITLAAEEDNTTHLNVTNFTAILGQGTRGEIEGILWFMGNHRMVEELGVCSHELEQQIQSLEQQGKTVVMLIGPQGVQGLFAVADTIKETSVAAIAELKKLGIKTVMLTGDNIYTANVIAEQAGIDQVKGNLLPADKLAVVSELSQSGIVGMVGDGINDAPALAKADIGFAMGAVGTDTAIETADVALMDDDLRKIPQFIRLSKVTFTILVQNITFALLVKALFFALTFMGEANMWMAVFADIGTSLLVVANGLRLLRK